MKSKILFFSAGVVFIFSTARWLCADQVEMKNGDRYVGKVVSVSADTVAVESQVLGKINVPRHQVANLAFGTNAVASQPSTNVVRLSVPTNLPTVAAVAALANTKTDLSAMLHNPGTNLNSIRQVREQMLAGNPAAAGKFDEMVGGLLSGKLDMNDLRREAKSFADQLRALKHDLGSDADDSFDGYLEVLDNFLKESTESGTTTPTAPQKTQVH